MDFNVPLVELQMRHEECDDRKISLYMWKNLDRRGS